MLPVHRRNHRLVPENTFIIYGMERAVAKLQQPGSIRAENTEIVLRWKLFRSLYDIYCSELPKNASE